MSEFLDAVGDITDWMADPTGEGAEALALSGIGNPNIRKSLAGPEEKTTTLGAAAGVFDAADTVYNLAKNGLKLGPQGLAESAAAIGSAGGDVQDRHRGIIEKLADAGVPGFEYKTATDGNTELHADASGLFYEDGFTTAYPQNNHSIIKGGQDMERKERVREAKKIEGEVDTLRVEAETGVADLKAAGWKTEDYEGLIADAHNRSGKEWALERSRILADAKTPGVTFETITVNGHDINVAVTGEFSSSGDFDNNFTDAEPSLYHDLTPEDLQTLGPKGYLEAKEAIQRTYAARAPAPAPG